MKYTGHKLLFYSFLLVLTFIVVHESEKLANQLNIGVEVVCADESQACEDALEDLQGGQVEGLYE